MDIREKRSLSDMLTDLPGDAWLRIRADREGLPRDCLYSGPAGRLPAAFACLPVRCVEEDGHFLCADVAWAWQETTLTAGDALAGLAPGAAVSLVSSGKTAWRENLVYAGTLEQMPERFRSLRAVQLNYGRLTSEPALCVSVLWEPERGGRPITVREAMPMLEGRTCEILDRGNESTCYFYGNDPALEGMDNLEGRRDRIQDLEVLDWSLDRTTAPNVVTLYVGTSACPPPASSAERTADSVSLSGDTISGRVMYTNSRYPACVTRQPLGALKICRRTPLTAYRKPARIAQRRTATGYGQREKSVHIRGSSFFAA